MHPIRDPDLGDAALLAAVAQKTAAAAALLRRIAADYRPAALANSLSAEDMVLTDLIAQEKLDIGNFSLDTGRLPPETYDLMAEIRTHYGLALTVYYPRHEAVEAYVREHGINAFYESVELRKACCHARKVEPLQRALAGKPALAIAVGIAGVAVAIGQAVGPHALDPALHDRRHAEPPQREVHDHRVCRQHLALFFRDVGGLAAMGERMPGFLDEGQPVPIGPLGEVLRIEHCLPSHGIQVRPHDRMTLCPQYLGGEFGETMGDGGRLRLGMDEKDLHGWYVPSAVQSR